MQPLSLFGPIDAVLGSGDHPLILYVLVVLAVANVVTRAIAHRSNVNDAREQGAEAVGQHPLHAASTILLILGSFYLMTVELHSGVVLSVLVVGMFVTDLFELEALRVEARNDRSLSRPNGAIAASMVVLLYAAYLSLFFVIAPVWNAVV
ncbi:DUF7313 family protein [Halococcus agarilyticus]|uniref:DUF7313 family protein n=1 Tax=Halococcus agarilyticus TaxID=1232219 RepID=UPI0006778FD1|nr:hypothetical protein [Halococcus agarilyticus]